MAVRKDLFGKELQEIVALAFSIQGWSVAITFAVMAFSFECFASTAQCDEWFRRAKIKESGQRCVLRCASLKTDMGTFDCADDCDRLCGVSLDLSAPASLNQFAYYFGLTADELGLVAMYPQEALVVYKQKDIAQGFISKHFKVDRPDSESDAIRHFTWAALLTKELGPELAQKFLDAHEAGLPASDQGRAMDLANNRAGILAAELLKRRTQCTLEGIESEAMKALTTKKLVVLKPGNIPRRRLK